MQPASTQPMGKPEGQGSSEDFLLVLLRGIHSHPVLADESGGREFRTELTALENRFKAKESPRQLAASAIDILGRLNTQASDSVAHQRALLAQAGADLAAQAQGLALDQAPADRLQSLEQLVGELSLDDLAASKARLISEIEKVRAEAVQERQKIGDLIADAVTQMGTASGQATSNSARVTGLAYTPDPLTGLASRAYAEGELSRAHAAKTTDCHLAIFVIKRLALINAKFGFAKGDQVLLKVVAHLTQGLAEFDCLFRWTPCSFVTMTPPDTSLRELRSKVQLIERTRVTPTLEWEGRSAMVPITLDCHIVSLKDFGAAWELFLRLDTLASDV